MSFLSLIIITILAIDVKKWGGKIGFDITIALTVLTRLIQAGGGFISVLLIARFLSANEQGYYYTFASILAIQIFFELGLSGIITQYAAHEFAHLNFTEDFQLIGDEYYKSRLSSLLRFCVKCFAIIAFVLFFVLMAAGYYFFNKYNKGIFVNWQNPWLILSLTTSLNLFIDPILAFFDGLGRIKDMAKIRLIQKLFNIFLLLFFFTIGLKLYSAALASLIAILVNYFQILSTKRLKILKLVWKERRKDHINYYKEIFPLQWKIALSWISGYFIFYFFSPVLFATEGATVAGQMGMSITLLGGISSISMSWINTKVPLFSSLIAKQEFVQLNKVFTSTVKQLAIVNFVGLTILLISVFFVQRLLPIYANRILTFKPLFMLCIVTFVNQFVASWGTNMRCYKQEPFLIASIVMAALCASSTLILGKNFGLYGMVSGYTFLTVFVSLPWAYYIYRQKTREYQFIK